MAVAGKKKYAVYLDEKNTEYVRSFLSSGKYAGGLSALVDAHILTLVKTLKASKYVQGQKLSAGKVIKIFLKGLKQKPV